MTYASFWIKQSIKRYLGNNGRSIRIPSGLQVNIIKYRKVITAFELQLGRRQTDKELGYIGVGIKALQAIKTSYYSDTYRALIKAFLVLMICWLVIMFRIRALT